MSTRFTLRTIAPAAALLGLVISPAALAHPGHGELGGNAEFLLAGLLHPLTGLDHVLMIVAVAAWAALLPARTRIFVALCLALFVGIGALVPVRGGPVLEAAIAITVIGGGMLLAIGRRAPLWLTGVLAGLFALIHGFAHGAEAPAYDGFYIGGLILATALLAQAASFLAAHLLCRPLWFRSAGLASAAAGAVALAN